MKNLKNISLIIALFLSAALTSCKKGGEADPGNQDGELINSAQLFLDNNTSVSLEGNDVVNATYTDNKLKIAFSQNGTEFTLEIPNYDISASQNEYTNATAALNLKVGAKTYNSALIFVPVIAGNPPHPVFVTDKTISIKTNNLKVNSTTTDVSILIPNGGELITAPVSNGNAAVYDSIGFVQGDGGKPNMIIVRIKQ